MKHHLSLTTLLLLLMGSSCQQSTNNVKKDETALVDETQTSNFAMQDSVLAKSMHQDEEDLSASLVNFNKNFFAFLEQNPSSIKYDFPKLIEGNMHIANSTDGKFRIYSWDDNQGGSMRYFNNAFQVSNPEKQLLMLITTEEERPYHPFYSHIETMELEGKVYYLAFARNIYSSKEVNYAVEVYHIEDNKIQPVKLFKTTDGLDYVVGDTFNYDELGDPDKEFIQFDAQKLSFSFPQVREDGTFSENRVSYQYKDKFFIRK